MALFLLSSMSSWMIQVPVSDLQLGGVTQALNWITNVFPEDIFTQCLLDRGRKCFVSVERFYVKAPLTMFSTKTRQGCAKILARVRWYNNICICRWIMMIRIIVSSRSGSYFLGHNFIVFKEESIQPRECFHVILYLNMLSVDQKREGTVD